MALSSPSPATTATARSGRLRLHRTDRQRRGEHADRRGAAAAGSDEATAVTAAPAGMRGQRGERADHRGAAAAGSDKAAAVAAASILMLSFSPSDSGEPAADAAAHLLSNVADARAEAPASALLADDFSMEAAAPTDQPSDSGEPAAVRTDRQRQGERADRRGTAVAGCNELITIVIVIIIRC